MVQKLINAHSCLIDNRAQCAWLNDSRMIGNRDSQRTLHKGPITQRHGNQQRPAGFARYAIDSLWWWACLRELTALGSARQFLFVSPDAAGAAHQFQTLSRAALELFPTAYFIFGHLERLFGDLQRQWL